MANIKLGDNTLTGVSKVKIKNADDETQYVEFAAGGASLLDNTITFKDSDENYAIVSQKSGVAFAKPTNPTGASGTVFKGWSATEGGDVLTFPYTPSSSAETLYSIYATTDPTLENNTWEMISLASQAGTASSIWSVGDMKKITLSGTCGTLALNNDVNLFILGFNHNSAIEGSGITFGCFKTTDGTNIDLALVDSKYGSNDSTGAKYFNMNHWGSSSSPYNTNYGGWGASDMRYDILGSTDNAPTVYGSTKTTIAKGVDPSSTCATNPKANTLMSCLPSDLRAVMKPITKYTDNVGNNSNVEENVTATVDYLPLLAEFEIFGSRSYANTYEQNKQAQYQYYINGNAKIKYKYNATSTACYWWERSSYYSNAYGFCLVRTDGSAYGDYSRYSHGVAPLLLI